MNINSSLLIKKQKKPYSLLFYKVTNQINWHTLLEYHCDDVIRNEMGHYQLSIDANKMSWIHQISGLE